MPFGRIGVVGAGIMGRGLAQALAQTGHDAVLVDITDDILDAARLSIRRSIKSAMLFDADLRAHGPESVMARITLTTDLHELANCDLVVENATERFAVKQDIYLTLDRILRADCIVAANTSAIPIARLAGLLRRPERVIGMHFINPVAQKPVVEVIRHAAMAPATLEGAVAFLAGMGKRAIVVNDAPGFVSNRVLMLTINEAIRVVEEGVAAPEDVDAIFTQCFAHRMGPLATADLIGLDTVLLTLEVLEQTLGDVRFKPAQRLSRMVAEGRLGRKRGEGFFTYPQREE